MARIDPGASDARPYGRRAFLGLTAVGLSSLVWGRQAWDALAGLVRPVTQALPAGVVPAGGWRIYTVAATMPRFDPASWRLRIDGLVQEPVTLTIEDVRALPRVDQISDFHCVTGWSVRDVHWTGVRLGDVLELARPRPGARDLSFVSAERPYVDTLTREQAGLGDVLLAYEQDGEPLSRAHGAPLRLVVPQMYGYKSVKWVERITLEADAGPGYWEQRGYDENAWIGRSNGL